MILSEVVKQTDKYNFHTHTQYCDGKVSMQTMAQAAAECEMLHLGFTPHAPIVCKSGCNMPFEAVKEYLSESERLKDHVTGMTFDFDCAAGMTAVSGEDGVADRDRAVVDIQGSAAMMTCFCAVRQIVFKTGICNGERAAVVIDCTAVADEVCFDRSGCIFAEGGIGQRQRAFVVNSAALP